MSRVALVAALALAGCSNEPSRDAPPETSAPEAPAAAQAGPLPAGCEGIESTILQAAATREGLRTRFGEPDSTTLQAVPNRHVEGATDTLFAIYYPGLTSNVHWPEGGADIPDLVTVTDNRYLAFPRIGVGAAADSVIAALGEPTAREADALVYACAMDVEQPVRFELADGRVRRIVIDYYVD
jgi:hypothetical protein